jgi:hypothetical protein
MEVPQYFCSKCNYLAAEYADFADVTLILYCFSRIFLQKSIKSASNQQNQRIQRLSTNQNTMLYPRMINESPINS